MSYIYGYVGGSGVISGGCTDWVGTKMTEKLKDGLMGVRPLPCVRDEHGEIKEQKVKLLLAKINGELDELKEAILFFAEVSMKTKAIKAKDELRQVDGEDIAEEAADTITAITTMLEALGIDAEMRDEAQRRVNNKNRERGRL